MGSSIWSIKASNGSREEVNKYFNNVTQILPVSEYYFIVVENRRLNLIVKG